MVTDEQMFDTGCVTISCIIIVSGQEAQYGGRRFVLNRTTVGRMFTKSVSSVTRKKDRRVARTQQLILEALRSLLHEQAFDTLTVQQIIDRANVGRATFYAHFDNKHDLLASGFEDLRASLRTRQREALSRRGSVEERVFAFSQELFAHVNEYREVFGRMVGKRSGATVQRLLHRILVDMVREDVNATIARSGRSAAQIEALVQFIAGGLFGLLGWWLNLKTPLSVAEVNALFRTLATPALKAGSR
jgi:AcrR family transcriptional regulator